jgi:Ca-activated chloride channel family protein
MHSLLKVGSRGRASALTAVWLAALTGACGDSGDSGYGGSGYPEPGPPQEQADPKQDPQTQGGEQTCDEEKPVELYLSPDDSNSTSSPVQVREAILGGVIDLKVVPIRTWEFLNYYSFGYERAAPGMVTVTPELARVDGAPEGQYVLQIGVGAEAIANADRPLMNVTLVLDESGSMQGVAIEMEREVCRQIAASLRAGDVVSMVGWDTENAVKLEGHEVEGASDPTVVALCDGLAPGGGTDLHGGLQAGYELAHKQYDQGRINRVVLISDGGANAGVTDVDIIAGGAGEKDEDGIYLVGVGVGTADTYNDVLMDVVTDHGRGASLFVPSVAEAKKMFGERFVQTMAVAVRDVRVRLDLPPGFSIVKFSGEEYASDPAEIEPQHLAPNDVMVFHQTIETCAPALVDDAATFTVYVTWKDAITYEQRELSVTRKIREAVGAETAMIRKGAAVFAFAELLKVYREGEAPAELGLAHDALKLAEAVLPGDADLAEIRMLLDALK